MMLRNDITSALFIRAFALTVFMIVIPIINIDLMLVHGQSSTATLAGTVVDEKDAVIANVDVAVTNTATGLERRIQTNSSGYFVVALLPAGRYNLKATQQGFATLEVKGIRLNVNDHWTIQLQLKVGPIRESVIVDGVTLIQKESATVKTLVDRQFIENLPLNGRSFSTLIELSPGTVLTKTPGQFSVNGQRTTTNYFTIDGASANIAIDPVIQINSTAGGNILAFSALGTASNLVSIDALQEFTIQSSTYAAEFGRVPGGQVAIATRAGTNKYHGIIFEYFRNDVLDANDWFANSRGLRKPALRHNDFGAVFSGPIVRDKTFFFASYEGLRLRQPQVGIRSVPTTSARNSAPIQIQPFLRTFTLPNGQDLGNGLAEFNASYSNPSRLDATSLRIDQYLNKRITFFGRYNYSPSNAAQRGGTPESALVSLNNSTSLIFKTITTTIGSTQILSSTVTNEIGVNHSTNAGGNIWVIDGFGGAQPPADQSLFPAFASSRDSLFGFFLTDAVGFLVGKNARNQQRQLNIFDNLVILAGSHQLKMGLDWRRLSPILDTSNYFQQASFQGVPGALTGIAAGVQVVGKSGRASTRVHNFSIYAQDTWHFRRRLALSYGLRWDFNPAPSLVTVNPTLIAIGTMSDPSSIRLAPAGSEPWNTSHSNLAPRFGVAYQLSQEPGRERVLRGGFGIFYDTAGTLAGFMLGGAVSSGTLIFSVPFPLTLAQATPPVPTNPTPPYSLVTAFELGLKQPRTYQWNVGVEQSLGANQMIWATYVGAAGRKLIRRERLFRPNPEFTNVNGITNLATSDYHSLQLQFKRRLSRGVQGLASYTWSHSIDIGSSDLSLTLPGSRLDPKVDRASSDFDVRHSFSAGITYDIGAGTLKNKFLRGWSANPLFRTRTATPVNILTGTRLFNVFSVVRPDLISGVPLYLQDSAVAGGRRFNRAAFALPPATRQGTLGRNALRGFPATQLDLAVHRDFRLTEQWTLQFRAELFNIFNHPNFADPEGNLAAGALFGQSTMMLGRSLGGLNPLYQIGGPRSTQFALRLQF